MAYFSNGTEGMNYESQYCDKCVHNRRDPDEILEPVGCKVWDLHYEYNYEQGGKTKRGKTLKEVLSALIPDEPDSHWPGKCTMFVSLDELLEEALAMNKEREYLRKLQQV
jgi:hypothetical protein